MAKYDSWVQTYEIKPPVGGKLAWGAKASVKEIGTGTNDDAITLHEFLGETKQEAAAKAQAEADEWIAEHSSDD